MKWDESTLVRTLEEMRDLELVPASTERNRFERAF